MTAVLSWNEVKFETMLHKIELKTRYNPLYLTLKQLSDFFENVILSSNIVPYNRKYFSIEMAQYNDDLVCTMDIDGLLL